MKILSSRRFALWWRLAREWFESKFSNIKTSTPYITMDGSSMFFNYFTPKQMEEVYMWLEDGLLNFEIRTDEEGQYSLLTKSDIQELDGMFVIGGEEHDLDTIIDTIPVDLKGYKVSEVRIEGIDADLLDADFTWRLAEIEHKVDNIKLPEIDTTELAKQGDNPEATNSAILSALNGVAASMYKGMPIVSQAGDATISPNVLNVWGEVTLLNITKGNDIDGITNLYLIRFVAGDNLQVSFTGFDLLWYGGSVPTWNAGSIYEINIVDNFALWAEFTPV